jgi:hypothetical protein
MSKNPVILASYFFLELAALAGMAYGAWAIHPILGVLLPVLAAAVWGIFRVPNEPGEPPVRVSGIIRLLIEATFFGLAVFLLYNAGQIMQSLSLGGVVLLIYALSYDRIIRFVKRKA